MSGQRAFLDRESAEEALALLLTDGSAVTKVGTLYVHATLLCHLKDATDADSSCSFFHASLIQLQCFAEALFYSHEGLPPCRSN